MHIHTYIHTGTTVEKPKMPRQFSALTKTLTPCTDRHISFSVNNIFYIFLKYLLPVVNIFIYSFSMCLCVCSIFNLSVYLTLSLSLYSLSLLSLSTLSFYSLSLSLCTISLRGEVSARAEPVGVVTYEGKKYMQTIRKMYVNETDTVYSDLR